MKPPLNDEDMKYFYESYGYGETIPKKNSRILFDVKEGEIKDLIVEEFANPGEKQFLYNKYSYDIGNCLSNWEEWKLSDVLIAIFVSYKTVPTSLRLRILMQLSKIEEFRPLLHHWIYKNIVE